MQILETGIHESHKQLEGEKKQLYHKRPKFSHSNVKKSYVPTESSIASMNVKGRNAQNQGPQENF